MLADVQDGTNLIMKQFLGKRLLDSDHTHLDTIFRVAHQIKEVVVTTLDYDDWKLRRLDAIQEGSMRACKLQANF